MICATTLAGTPLSCAHDEYVRLNVSHVARGRSAASQAGQTHRRKTLFGEIGLPDTVEKISSWAAGVSLHRPRRGTMKKYFDQE